MILTHEDITLRPWAETDAEDLYNLAKNPNIGPKAGWPPHKSVEESLNVIKNIFSQKETYAIIYEDKIVGCVGLLFYPNCHQDWGKDAVELGYWIGEEYQNRGICTKASKILVKRAFKDLNVKAIYATYYIDNIKSKRVLEKLGFKYYNDLEITNEDNQKCKAKAMVLNNDIKYKLYFFKIICLLVIRNKNNILSLKFEIE